MFLRRKGIVRGAARAVAIHAAALALFTAAASAQDANIYLAVAKIEQRLRDGPFLIQSARDTRFIGDRTQQVTLSYPDEDGGPMQVKWAPAPRGGAEFNNEPRYEIAAYELQKLFLDEPSFVVPPTIGRVVPLSWLRQYDPDARATFEGANSVLLVVQYWLQQVNGEKFWDEDRFVADTVYARHFADFNLLTHLIRHRDANTGNYLISTSPTNVRVFSVDNGISFGSPASNRGTQWQELRVDRLPRASVERLRALTEEDLQRALSVVLQLEIRDGELTPVERSASLDEGRGVRRSGTVVQLGLTRGEIRDVYQRVRDVIERVDSGRTKVF
jgi:hypothetical protein